MRIVLQAMMVAALATGGAASAADVVDVGAAAANFSNGIFPPAGSAVYASLDGLPGFEKVSYGTPATPGGPINSLTFASALPGSVAIGSTFTLGSLTLVNLPTFNAATGFDLSITSALTFAGNALSAGPFKFKLAIDNTPNAPPCAYPSTTPCADALTIALAPGPVVFDLNGQTLTLFIDGFKDSDGKFSKTFVAQENGSSVASLIGRFGLASDVPEPSVWATMILGFALTGMATRRRAARTNVVVA